MRRFILSEESVNSYGFRVLTQGIDIESRYLKNPVILYQHNDKMMSVGKMKISKEGDKLIGIPEFDLEDPIGKELARKYEKGYMNGFSIGIDGKEYSDSPEHLLPGQRLFTMTKGELFEVSVANVPSNQNAVRLASGDINEVPKIKLLNTDNKMKKIALAFGLGDDSTEDQVLLAFEAKKKELIKLKAENKELNKANLELIENSEKEKLVTFETLLNDPKKAFTKEQKDTYRDLAKVDYPNAVKLVGLQKNVQTVHNVPNAQPSADKYADRTFKELQKEAPEYLAGLKASNPDKLQELINAQYRK